MCEVCAAYLLTHPISIVAQNTTVEIDESQFSRKKNNHGHVFSAQWVFDGICVKLAKVSCIYEVQDRSAATLLPFQFCQEQQCFLICASLQHRSNLVIVPVPYCELLAELCGPQRQVPTHRTFSIVVKTRNKGVVTAWYPSPYFRPLFM